MSSQTRQNYHQDCEAGVNKQIHTELYASYVFQAVAFYFDRDDVALPGFHKFFKELSDEERKDAETVSMHMPIIKCLNLIPVKFTSTFVDQCCILQCMMYIQFNYCFIQCPPPPAV